MRYGTMILFNEVVQILDLTHLNGGFPFTVDAPVGGQIGAAFVHGNGLRRAIPINVFLEVTTVLPSARYKYFNSSLILT